MLTRRRLTATLARLAAAATIAGSLVLPVASASAQNEPLKIGYSDWPGWVAWEIGIQKGWFEEADVDVDFLWFDYVASMDAYVAGRVDAVAMTNGDALVTGGTGKPSVTILINDYSNGNDMLVVKPEVKTVAGLKGKKIGAELGFVGHLLAITGLEMAGLSADDVEFVDTPTDQTASVLANGDVSAIAAWQPNSGEALKAVEGARALFTSADAPGIIYDVLAVSPESLESRRDDWMKVIGVWYRIVEYLKDEDNMDDALAILAARVNVTPREYEPFFEGTYILTLDEAMERWEEGDGLGSIYGSTAYVNAFNVEQGVYDKPLDVSAYLDPSLMEAFAEMD
ncbi:ABC transporter substrate-binding protein [Phycisphaera mikurensis]|uniref:ABC transporter substrate binding protein n=1 Tax=Phycisphaera mikurensis (strain NBRC 102666 / KCTC 22515 / FYK2301M01) TaxID=1142394 RepID=I0IE00_PHYMF|nr:ABC transporter substrate-binding protein [Phycisphaera mikurensis]MBB6441295.1 NitT/TauT family transport system substrate-binding protein [Phycisphaera mikurensis]BAM03488.1 ABC transporter substrate binding protein [Phycisphaera mikurensis NBRC 102666]